MGHHYNPASMMIIPPTAFSHPNYEIVFFNTDSGEQVRLTVPKFGMFEEGGREITLNEVERLAEDIARLLHDFGRSGASISTP